MKERAWLSFVSAGIAVLGLISAYSHQLSSEDRTKFNVAQALIYKVEPYAWEVGLLSGVSLILSQLLQGISAGPHFRKETIQNVLDVLVSQCEGKERENRITLFKSGRGWEVWLRAVWRLKWDWFSDEKRNKRLALRSIKLFSDYLYVYVRSKQARHPLSTAAFRISDRRELCQGMAGRAWDEKAFICVPNLPEIKQSDRNKIRTMTVEEILRLPGTTRLRKYVEATGIRDTLQLRGVESFARHFMGHDVRRVDGEPWGVLLLDSDREKCPFSPTGDGGELGAQFRTQAVVLGNLVK